MKKILRSFLAAAASLAMAAASFAAETVYPVTVDNGNRRIVFEKAPERVVTNGDSNIIELMFALGLEGRVIGYAGFNPKRMTVSDKYVERLSRLKMISDDYITLEQLVGANPDMFLSGYFYGLDIPGDTTGSAITPEELDKYGIKSYAITESLIRVMKKPPVSLEDTYNDVRNLGVIFNVQDEAAAVISSMKARAAAVTDKTAAVREPVNVFILRVVTDTDVAIGTAAKTVGGQAMPSALTALAGGRNVFGGVDDSWIKVSWEEVIGHNPDVIVILAYGFTIDCDKIAETLRSMPELSGVRAVKNNRIYSTRVENTYPGPRAVDGLEILAKFYHPELF